MFADPTFRAIHVEWSHVGVWRALVHVVRQQCFNCKGFDECVLSAQAAHAKGICIDACWNSQRASQNNAMDARNVQETSTTAVYVLYIRLCAHGV